MEKEIYCPICGKYGRQKKLFTASPDTVGTIGIKCRGCRQIIKINIGREPQSRK